MLLRPKTTFREAAGDPLWFVVSLYVLLVVLGSIIRILFPLGSTTAVPAYTTILRYEAVFSLITALALTLSGSGILAIVLRIAGKKQTLRPAVRVFCSAGIPSALFQILLGVFILLPLQGALPYGIVSYAEAILWILVLVWTVVLTAIGLMAIPGLSAPGAALCSVGDYSVYLLCSMVLMVSSGWTPLVSATNLLARLLVMTVVLVGVFACYVFLEWKKLVQDPPDGWQDTQVASWIALPVLAAGFLYLPIWHHGGYTMMSQLSANLDMIPRYLAGSTASLHLNDTGATGVFFLIVLVYFLHATGIIGKGTSLLAPVLSLPYLWFCGNIVSEWEGFYHSSGQMAVAAGWGTWIVPLAGLIYFIIVFVSLRGVRQPPPQPPATCTPPDSVLSLMETVAKPPAGTAAAPDSFYLPPVSRTPASPDERVPVAPLRSGKPDPLPAIPAAGAIPPGPGPVLPEPAQLPRPGAPGSPGLQAVQPSVTIPLILPSAVREPVAPILPGVPESPRLQSVQPSRTIAIGAATGAEEPDTVPAGEPAGTRVMAALRYAVTAMTGSMGRAVLLIIAALFLVPLFGYLVRVLKGADPAPEVTNGAGLIADGIRVSVIIALYTILAVVLVVLLGRSNLLAAGMVVVMAVLYLLPAVLLHFARTGSVASAFRIGDPIGRIRAIGWIPYTGLFLLCFVLNTGTLFAYSIPYAGPVLLVLLVPLLAIFEARYLALLAERSGA